MPAFLTFDSNEVCELVGIGPLLLNKFVERKTYGIQPSVRRGKGRGGRRLFSPDDVFGIALIWWFFESGLRSNVIQVVVDEICQAKNSRADQAAKRLIEKKIQVVRVQTQPRRENPNVKMPRHMVFLTTEEKPNVLRATAIALDVPVGHLYSILLDKMKRLTGLPQGE
jgi:DNA-binding transcriptional MerR regulator